MIDDLSAAFATVSIAEVAAVILAVAYLVLAVRQNIFCWLAALLSALLYMGIFFAAALYMESALQIFYAAMAIYGWYAWRYGGAEHTGVRINVWNVRRHAAVLTTVAALSFLLGWVMSHTDAAFPYADSFTTVAAIVTTYMVARKVLENWVYWFAIDSVSVYLYSSRGLYLTTLLFLLYLVLIVVGFRTWLREYRHG